MKVSRGLLPMQTSRVGWKLKNDSDLDEEVVSSHKGQIVLTVRDPASGFKFASYVPQNFILLDSSWGSSSSSIWSVGFWKVSHPFQ